MGKDLTSMIDEINDASSSLNKNNKPDDPVSCPLERRQQIEMKANEDPSYLKLFESSTAILPSFSKLIKVRLPYR